MLLCFARDIPQVIVGVFARRCNSRCLQGVKAWSTRASLDATALAPLQDVLAGFRGMLKKEVGRRGFSVRGKARRYFDFRKLDQGK